MKKNKKNFAATPYMFTLYIEAGKLESLKGAMDEDERLSLIQMAKDETANENAQLAARTDDDWRREVDHTSKPYGWWSWDKERQEAWIAAEVSRQKSLPPYTWQATISRRSSLHCLPSTSNVSAVAAREPTSTLRLTATASRNPSGKNGTTRSERVTFVGITM